jgi:16S rRNA (cytosine967-C5)-methyltransferase
VRRPLSRPTTGPGQRRAGRSGAPRPPSRVNAGRLAAIRALVAVEHGEHVEDALARLAPAAGPNRALAWHLALGVLRSRTGLDELVRIVGRRGVSTLDPPVAAAVRVALFELRRAGVAPHAAVDQAVEAVRALGLPHAAGFANAILRRSVEVPLADDAWLGHPAWLVERWRSRHGREAADAWMHANNAPACVHLVCREDPAGVVRAFQHAGMVLVPSGPDGVFRLPAGAGAPEGWPGFAEGRWWIMDPVAVQVADLCGDIEGRTVLDTCAAPGGKSFRLASRGARVLATDAEEARLARLREGAARLGLAVESRVHDWSAGAAATDADVVLVDAPCSGLGVVRRHPDIRWRRVAEDLPAFAARQRAILRHAAGCVRPGGVLVYAVCSPEPEEGEEVAASLGWREEARLCNAPARDGADVFQAFRLRAPG